MRTKAMIQKDLDAVARQFPNSRGSMLAPAVGRTLFQTGRPSFDFLGGQGLSPSEQQYAQFFNTQLGVPVVE